MILEVKDLSVSYKSRAKYVTALKKVSWGIKEGEILGIVGESGSGKSTLALSILNLLPSDSENDGQIIFKDKNIFKAISCQLYIRFKIIISHKKLEGEELFK